MRTTDTADLWYKNAIIYCLDVKTFLDSNGDGMGDLPGVAQRVDYLAGMGVTCLWLMPFYPSPLKDNGYDVSDMFGVHPALGDHGDVVELIHTARDRGIRVIVDLLVNHTSDQHEWFRQARRSKDNPYRNYYVWRDDDPGDTSAEAMFPEAEDGIWTYEEKTEEWYLHHFFSHQPDLNTANPEVRNAIAKAMGFWLQLGVDGFRVDAVPFALNESTLKHLEDSDLAEPHDYLRALRSFLQRRSTTGGSAIMLGEVNMPYEDQVAFFGGEGGDQLTMQFDFLGNQRTMLAMARQDAGPIRQTLRERPSNLPVDTQFANFLRNHDELALDQLPEEEREEIFAAFGPEEDHQLFGHGLRRRLASMFKGDPRRLKMSYSLLFALPGTPVLYYGQEIGMGEELSIEGRGAIRTPMQWTSGKNGGFSSAAPSKLVSPLTEGSFGPRHVNVADSRRDPHSLLNHITHLAHIRRESPEIGWGSVELLEQPNDAVLAYCCSWDEARTVLLHNLSPEPAVVPIRLEGEAPGTMLADLLENSTLELDADCRAEANLDGYGYRWLRVKREGDPRLI